MKTQIASACLAAIKSHGVRLKISPSKASFYIRRALR